MMDMGTVVLCISQSVLLMEILLRAVLSKPSLTNVSPTMQHQQSIQLILNTINHKNMDDFTTFLVVKVIELSVFRLNLCVFLLQGLHFNQSQNPSDDGSSSEANTFLLISMKISTYECRFI